MTNPILYQFISIIIILMITIRVVRVSFSISIGLKTITLGIIFEVNVQPLALQHIVFPLASCDIFGHQHHLLQVGLG